VLVALRVEAERDEQHVVLADVHAVDHQHDEIDRAEIATEPLGHLLLGRGDERRLTALRLVPRVTTSSGTGSSDRA
jgi:hypothetical protein